MIDMEEWLRVLDEEEDLDARDNETYQQELFEECIFAGDNNPEERRRL